MSLRFSLLAVLAPVLALALASAANAADLAVPEIPLIAAAPSAPHDWNGFYAGVHLGWAGGETSRPGATSGKGDGVLGGGQVGFNWQSGMLVLGAETDLSGLGLETRSSAPGGVTVLRTEPAFFGTVRGRVGAAFDRVLVYGTGGFAYGGFDQDLQVLGVRARNSDTQIGWSAGGGVEVAVTGAISLRAEYLYADLGTATVRFNNPAGVRATERISWTQQAVRLAVNYKF